MQFRDSSATDMDKGAFSGFGSRRPVNTIPAKYINWLNRMLYSYALIIRRGQMSMHSVNRSVFLRVPLLILYLKWFKQNSNVRSC